MRFVIFPAIDLRQGQVVRLCEGDPLRQTIYATDAGEAARRWLAAGAEWLHVVNLDGAFGESEQANRRALESILEVTVEYKAQVQFGGGLRSLAVIEQVFSAGVTRVILGTSAVEQPEILAAALEQWGTERVAVSLDARDGVVRKRGWMESTDLNALTLARQLQETGLRWLIFTDIARDGVKQGLNLGKTVELASATGLKVIASGGVSNLEDIEAARRARLAGVIVGRALYDGLVDPMQLFAHREVK